MKILVYGYGNPGRKDDGLGIVFSERTAELKLDGVETDSNYQLNAEDALAIADMDVVIFVDATQDATVNDFTFSPLNPDLEIEFTTHAMKPGSVLALCNEIYKKEPHAFVLAIRGYDWDFSEGLSNKAKKNLNKAYEYLKSLLEKPSIELFNKSVKSS